MSLCVGGRHLSLGRISRETLSIWLFSAALVLAYVVPSELTSVMFFMLVLVLMLGNPGAIDRKTAGVLKPIMGMALLGLIYGFSNAPVDIVRDVWLVVKALTCILLGYSLARLVKRIDRLLKQFVLVSLFLSMLFIAPYLAGSRELGIENSGGFASLPLATVLALPLLLMRGNGLVRFGSRHFRRIAVIVILLAYGLSFSRTGIGCAVIMVLAAVGVFDNLKRLFIYGAVFASVAFFSFQLLPSIDTDDITFASKIGNSLSEIAFTDGFDPREMLTNWRGFEAYRAFIDFIETAPLQQLLGRGLGATVDLGVVVQMSEKMNFRFIPHLHNGYMHILSKFGVIGVLLYVLFLYRISMRPLSVQSTPGQITVRRVLIGMSIVLAYTTLVITGIFNKGNHDSFLIMMGVFFWISYNLGRNAGPPRTPVKPQISIGRRSQHAA